MHMFTHWHTHDSRLTGVLSYYLDIAPNTGGNVPVASPIFKDYVLKVDNDPMHTL